jgi:hypothetical protein
MYDAAISLLDIFPQEFKAKTPKDTCTLIFQPALLKIAKRWKHPNCPSTDKQISITWHMHDGYISALRRNEILIYVTTCLNFEDTI